MRLFFKLFFKTLRLVLAPFMLLWERLTTPKGIERSAEIQAMIDAQTRSLALYQFRTCPFCIKVRREISRLSLNIPYKDAQRDPVSRGELKVGGGEVKVPCLRIVEDNGKVRWMYESAEIIGYLQQRFAEVK